MNVVQIFWSSLFSNTSSTESEDETQQFYENSTYLLFLSINRLLSLNLLVLMRSSVLCFLLRIQNLWNLMVL